MSAQSPDQSCRPLPTEIQQSPEPDTSKMPSRPPHTSPPQTSLPSASQPPQDRTALAEQLGKRFLSPLSSSTLPHISFSDLTSKYGVSAIRKLDFYSGKVDSNAPEINSQFVVPRDPQQILAWLNETQAREVCDDLPQGPTCLRPNERAMDLWRLIDTHLTRSGQGREPGGFLENYTTWGPIRLRGGPFIQRWDEGCQDWQVQVARRSHIKPPGAITLNPPPYNPETPHVIVAMIDAAPLQETHISTGEMTVLVYFSLLASRFSIYQKHTLFPVTLLIMSDRKVRITQCIYNIKQCTFEIRKTPIVSFEAGIWERNQKQHLALLGWMSGKPAGLTK